VQDLPELFENNRRWAARCVAARPDFFDKLKAQQAPEYLWIGCSDSRVPANEIVGLMPGELFVHRNVANVVVHSDLNCLSVLQYAVDVLRVGHVIVCGHYGCSGVRAAVEGAKLGLIDNWLRHVQDVHAKYRMQVDNAAPSTGSGQALSTGSGQAPSTGSEQAALEVRVNKLCELNAIEQAVHVCKSTVVQDAWARGQSLAVHALVYGLDDGRLRDLGFSVTSARDLRSGVVTALNTRPQLRQA
jgi:carbonic anhydrase